MRDILAIDEIIFLGSILKDLFAFGRKPGPNIINLPNFGHTFPDGLFPLASSPRNHDGC